MSHLAMRRPTVLYVNSYVGSELRNVRDLSALNTAGSNRVRDIVRSLEAIGQPVVALSYWGGLARYSLAWLRPVFDNIGKTSVCHAGFLDWPILRQLTAIVSLLYHGIRISRATPVRAVLVYNSGNPTIALPAVALSLVIGVPLYVEVEEVFDQSSTNFLKGLAAALTHRITWSRARGAGLLAKCMEDRIPTRRKVHTPPCYDPLLVAAEMPDVRQSSVSFPNGPITVLYSGSISQLKGIYVLLDALDILDRDPTSSTRMRVWICGQGKTADQLTVGSRVNQLKNLDAKYWGYVSQLQYMALLQQAHITVTTQLLSDPFSYVCFPYRVAEHMAAGKVVISTAISDLPTYPSDVIVTYDRDDPQLLAETLRRVVLDYEQYASYGARAREWIKQTTSYEIIGQRLMELMDQG